MRGDRKYLAFVLTFLTLLSVFFYYRIHLEIEAECEEVKSKIAQNQKQIILINKFSDTHKQIDEEMASLAKRHFPAVEAFPEFLNEESVISYLNEAATDHNLQVLLLNSDDLKEDNDKKSFIKVFHIKVQGDYFHILDFLYELNNSDKFFDARRFYLKNDNGILTLDMEINRYFSNNNTR